MSSLVRFLEQAGRLGYGRAAMKSEISSLDIDPEVRKALENGDMEVLTSAMGGRSTMRCAIFSPD